jgi:hypothetical protein
MSALDLATANLLSPVVLCFALGAVAVLVRSDLRLPEPVFNAISIYLMLAIGLKGGADLAEAQLAAVALPALAALGLGAMLACTTYAITLHVLRFSVSDAAALAAHYGSVSAVTFIAVLAYLDATGIAYESFVTALLAIMEIPAIVIALALARAAGAGGGRASLAGAFAHVAASKSVLLLMGGLVIGALVGQKGLAPVKPFFGDLFRGVLCLFLLELGVAAAQRARDLRKAGLALASLAILAPIAHGVLGAFVGWSVGLSLGGAIVLATLAASSSYIAAPAAVRLSLPEANPGLYLTASLAITFPFNLAIGIPLYALIAKLIYA